MHAWQVEQGVDARAVTTRLCATRRRLSHRRGPSVGSLVATDPEGPRPISPGTTRPARPGTPHPREIRRAGKGLVPHRAVSTVTDLIKVVNGVRAVVILETNINDGVLAKSELALQR